MLNESFCIFFLNYCHCANRFCQYSHMLNLLFIVIRVSLLFTHILPFQGKYMQLLLFYSFRFLWVPVFFSALLPWFNASLPFFCIRGKDIEATLLFFCIRSIPDVQCHNQYVVPDATRKAQIVRLSNEGLPDSLFQDKRGRSRGPPRKEHSRRPTASDP